MSRDGTEEWKVLNGLCNKKKIYHLANLINVLPLNPLQFLVFFFYSNLAGERKRDVLACSAMLWRQAK